MRYLLYSLLLYRFGKWFIWVAISNVVNSVMKILNPRPNIFEKLTWTAFLLVKRFPFDWHNPIGYLIAVTVEYVIFGYECFIIACVLSFGIGAIWLIISVTKEIRHTLHSINDVGQENKIKSNELKRLFSEYFHTYAAIKQLSILEILKQLEWIDLFWNVVQNWRANHVSAMGGQNTDVLFGSEFSSIPHSIDTHHFA